MMNPDFTVISHWYRLYSITVLLKTFLDRSPIRLGCVGPDQMIHYILRHYLNFSLVAQELPLRHGRSGHIDRCCNLNRHQADTHGKIAKI